MKRWFEHLLSRTKESSHLRTGRWGERQAVRMLKAKGWSIIGERVRVGRHDEIDIIAMDRSTLVFVEVKTRKNEAFGRPFSSVGAAKKKRLSRAAVTYLKKKNIEPDYLRFDVVEVLGEPKGKPDDIRHIESAFTLDSRYRLWW